MTPCPDCKDGFYYPLFGQREKCQTCQGACHVIVIEMTAMRNPAFQLQSPNVQNVSHEMGQMIGLQWALAAERSPSIQRFLKRYANLSSSPGFRTVSVDSRQQEIRQTEDRSEAVDVGPCGAD